MLIGEAEFKLRAVKILFENGEYSDVISRALSYLVIS
ncbi:hypothetical protein BMS3Bbin15_00589 [archaeon BMS3Bbin15]|nr:hypothetical protein BMS3Bbin15_00589 [archaeon BMS3Bbin15]